MRVPLAVAAAVATTLAAAPTAWAQPATSPPPSGLYEDYSPVRMAPVGPLSSPPSHLPRWLSVRTRGSISTITFEPARRVVWEIAWGPHGPVRKRVEVDGAFVSSSSWGYDRSGCLETKHVDGPGVTPTVWRYRTDVRCRVRERRGRVSLRRPWMSRNLPVQRIDEVWGVRHGGRRSVATLRRGGRLVRRDVFDPSGLRLRTDFGDGSRRARLFYRRGSQGALRRVDRQLDNRRGPARPGVRDRNVGPADLTLLRRTQAERHELLLLLGSPAIHTDEGSAVDRRISDTYSDGCWLDQPSTLEYDAGALLITAVRSCICGFCVDAALPVRAEDVHAVDLHWTVGPWVRLDGAVDVTAEHRVLTPDGPVPAGELSAGDVVLDADGRPRTLRSVRTLPPGPERLGRNVRTASGTFAAGGILFESEAPRRCD